MRYVTYSLPGEPGARLGIVRGETVVDVKNAVAGRWPGACPEALLELIDQGPDAWRRMAGLLDREPASEIHLVADLRLHAPIPRPRKNIFCLGQNYASHAREAARARDRPFKIPEAPAFFTKAPTTVNGPYDDVPWDSAVTGQLDYEAELGVIVGLTTKNILRARALEHVFGYTIVNDLSARDLQLKHLQWFKGKSLDRCCPMGPLVVTADEFGDPQAKRISLRVNGIVKQDATTADMIFPVDVTLEFLSLGMTIEPGDIIATGTPEGVGLGRTPPEYLRDGDLVETEIEGIGTMRNRVVRLAT
jgi:2-keto-4-pentenoate hydratase/2-oxohepta-3-ene-1,7-dioic acid hydratase in catechol pathway